MHVGVMAKEILSVFNARQLMPEEYGVTRSCTLFLTNSRQVLVAPVDSVNR